MNLDIKEYIEKEFYYLHSHPELSYQEYETTKRLKTDLQDSGIEILPYHLDTGVVASIGSGERTVAIRADIDALPIQEEADVAYKSLSDGATSAVTSTPSIEIVRVSAISLQPNTLTFLSLCNIILSLNIAAIFICLLSIHSEDFCDFLVIIGTKSLNGLYIHSDIVIRTFPFTYYRLVKYWNLIRVSLLIPL